MWEWWQLGLTSSCLEADKVETVISGMEVDKLKHPQHYVNTGYVAEKICKKKLLGPPYTHTNLQSFKEACRSLFLLLHHSTGPTKPTDFLLLNFEYFF